MNSMDVILQKKEGGGGFNSTACTLLAKKLFVD